MVRNGSNIIKSLVDLSKNTISDQHEIADKFNNYFITIPKELRQNIIKPELQIKFWFFSD